MYVCMYVCMLFGEDSFGYIAELFDGASSEYYVYIKREYTSKSSRSCVVSCVLIHQGKEVPVVSLNIDKFLQHSKTKCFDIRMYVCMYVSGPMN